jgi:hypothetical protein
MLYVILCVIISDCDLYVVCYIAISNTLSTTYYLLPPTYYLLPTTYYLLLPPTSYLLPPTYYLLPPTSYLPPPLQAGAWGARLQAGCALQISRGDTQLRTQVCIYVYVCMCVYL